MMDIQKLKQDIKAGYTLGLADALILREALAHLEKAESKLAELADTAPVAYIIQDAEERGRGRPGFLSYDRSISDEDINEYEISVTPLFTRAAPPVPDLAALVPDGWRLVPIEPTEEMLSAGDNFMDGLSELGNAYSAMLEVAPKPEDKC